MGFTWNNKNPQFPIFDHLESAVTDGCKHMAWFGEIGGEKRYLF